MGSIDRQSGYFTRTVPNGSTSTVDSEGRPVGLGAGAMGSVFVPTGYPTAWTFEQSHDKGATWKACLDETGAAITQTMVVDSWNLISPNVMAFRDIRATHTATGADYELIFQIKG